MKKHLLIVSAMAVFALVGCSKNEGGGGNLDPEAKTPISISTTITRATDTEFEDGDKIGLYVVNYNGSAHEIAAEGNHVTNADFSFNGSAWTPSEEIFWRDMVTHADFYAYYPFIETISEVNALPWSVAANQSDEADYWAGDFMWTKNTDVTPTTAAVPLQMKHILSNATVTVKGGTGFEEDVNLENANVELYFYGLKTAATINLADGVVTPAGEATVVTPWKDVETTTTGEGEEAVTETSTTYRAMVIPQTIEAGKTLISVSVNNTVYPLVVEEGFTFEPSKKHNFTLTVNASKVNLSVEIVDWEEADLDNSDISPMGQAKSVMLPVDTWTAMTDAQIYGSYWGGSSPTEALQAAYPGVTYSESSFKQAGAYADSALEKIWDRVKTEDGGEHAGIWTYMNSCWNSPEGQTYPFSIFIDLGGVVQIDALRLYCRGGRSNSFTPGHFRIWVSDDNTPENGILDGWVEVCEEDARVSAVGEWNYEIAYQNGYLVEFDSRTKPCRYVRFEALDDRSNGTYNNSTTSIAELEFFGVQHNF